MPKVKDSFDKYVRLGMVLSHNASYENELPKSSYHSVISIVFGFEFAMAALVVVGQKELRHFQEHKAFDHSSILI